MPCGISFAHGARHAFRTAGWALPLKTVQVRMGHSTLAMVRKSVPLSAR